MKRAARRIRLPNGGSVSLGQWSTDPTPRLRNVVGLSEAGTIRWRAELPEDDRDDCYVGLREQDGTVIATTYTGTDVQLCPETGRHLALSRAAPSDPRR
jgi:hypothetical protein